MAEIILDTVKQNITEIIKDTNIILLFTIQISYKMHREMIL